jgi:hypothetical protein
MSLILASLNRAGNSATVVLRALIVATSNEMLCSLAAYSCHSDRPNKNRNAAWERGRISLPHCLGLRALGKLLLRLHVLDAEPVNAHVPVGISAAAATTKEKPYVGYKTDVLFAQAHTHAFLERQAGKAVRAN